MNWETIVFNRNRKIKEYITEKFKSYAYTPIFIFFFLWIYVIIVKEIGPTVALFAIHIFVFPRLEWIWNQSTVAI